MTKPIQILPTRLAHSIMIVSGGFAVVLGLLVLLGWHTHNVHLLQIIPTFAPMQYNAALGLLLCGSGVLARLGGWTRLAGLCGVLVMLLGGLTCSEYLSGIDLGIDQLFMQHFIAMATVHPGRMSPNTALCFMLLGTIVVVMRTSGHGARALLLTGLGSVAVMALGLVACFGYLVQVKGVPGWAYFTDMAVHATVGCILLGLGLTVGVWRQGKVHPTWAPRWGIALAGLSIATATLCLWQALLVEERAHILGATSLQAASVQRQIVARMESRIVSLVRMARGWERRGKPEKEAWESDAELYVSLYHSSQAMIWVDPSLHVRWVAPLTGNETAQDFDLGFEEQRRRTLELVGGKHTAMITPQEGAILVVDDESGITSALEYLLQCDGYQVETAANGRMALEKLCERTYDLLLSDLRMPELDGMGLYEELAQHYPHLLSRLIFLTGDTLNAETTRLLEQVGAPRLSKPFTATEVRRVVQQALHAL